MIRATTVTRRLRSRRVPPNADATDDSGKWQRRGLGLDGRSLFAVILVSWGIAFFEYCLMVPANRAGYLSGTFTGYQLKILQEIITLTVFVIFAWAVLKEKLTWNYAVSFGLILAAVWFAVGVKPGTSSTVSGH